MCKRLGRPLLIATALAVLLLAPSPGDVAQAFEIPSRNVTAPTGADGPLAVAPGELVLAVAVMRHGDRAPQRHAPAFAAGDRSSLVGRPLPIDSAPWRVDYGQLTELGMEQTREFGRRLRERYVVSKKGKPRRFLSRVYKHAETHVRSTDVDRTLVSAMNAMLGLYEEGDGRGGGRGGLGMRGGAVRGADAGERFSRVSRGVGEEQLHLKREPQHVTVPVHTVEYKRDALLDSSAKAHCPRFFATGEQMLSTEFCKGAILRNTELLNALPALAGRKASSLTFPQLVDTLAALRDVRVAQRAHGVKQTENVTRFDAALDDIVARIAIAKWDVSGLGPLVGGRLLKAVAKRMEAVKGLLAGDENVRDMSRDECNAKGSDSDEDGGCPRKLVLYVGHDTTVFDVRSGLGLNAVGGGADGNGVSPYASHVIFELRRKKGKKQHKPRRASHWSPAHLWSRARSDAESSEDYDYTVEVLEGSYEQKTKSTAGPFCGGKSKCSLDSFLKFVSSRMPVNIDKACGLDDGTKPSASSAWSSSPSRGNGQRSIATFPSGGFIVVVFSVFIGAFAGYIVGILSHRAGYQPIPEG